MLSRFLWTLHLDRNVAKHDGGHDCIGSQSDGLLCFTQRRFDNGRTSAYSVRNACIGSIRDALHAGIRQARAATNSSAAATAAKIAGSKGRLP